MDIDLFSEIIKDLAFDSEEIAIPGLGTFVSEVVPSSFSDKGYTINPPYRKLSFRQRQGDGSRLLDFYSMTSGIAPEKAGKILEEFISGLRQTLKSKKMVVFPGLGRLRATKENTFFFIPDEDLDIYSYGFGLEPVSLKTHEETPDEVSTAVAGLRAIVDATPVTADTAGTSEYAGAAVPSENPEPSADSGTASASETKAVSEYAGAAVPSETPEPSAVSGTASASETKAVSEYAGAAVPSETPEPTGAATPEEENPLLPAEEAASAETGTAQKESEEKQIVTEAAQKAAEEVRDEAAAEPKQRTAAAKLLIALAVAVAAALLLLGIFILLSRVAPDFTDRLLYTQEELRILNS